MHIMLWNAVSNNTLCDFALTYANITFLVTLKLIYNNSRLALAPKDLYLKKNVSQENEEL